MKLTVLVDNNTYIDQYYLGEPAVCYYIEDGETRLLLDTGYSDVYIRNAKALGDRPGTGLCNRFVPWAQRPYPWIAILVRGYVDSNDVCHVGKLIVHPGYQNQGIGKALMYEIEKYFPACCKLVLFTGEETPNTLHLYEKVGYHIVSKEKMGGLSMILMEKENQFSDIHEDNEKGKLFF